MKMKIEMELDCFRGSCVARQRLYKLLLVQIGRKKFACKNTQEPSRFNKPLTAFDY